MKVRQGQRLYVLRGEFDTATGVEDGGVLQMGQNCTPIWPNALPGRDTRQ